jgi:hypothetical protein
MSLENKMQFPGAQTNAEEEKLSLASPYEELEAKIPEVAAMKGFDQRSDFHDLTLDEHNKEFLRRLEGDEFIAGLPEKEKGLVVLAGKLHDLGKTSPEGQKPHPKEPGKMQYPGHEKESERMAREVLSQHFSLSKEDAEFVAKLTGLHASALNLVNNFQGNREPKGKDLKAYDDFMKKAEEIPGPLTLIDKMKIVFALNKADIRACYNGVSDKNSEKVKTIMERAETQIKVLGDMEKALPALLEAVEGRRGGDQTAGIVCENGEYKYVKPEAKPAAEIPAELKKLGGVLRDKTKDVAEIYPKLKAQKGNEKALAGMVNGVLKNKIGLSEEQIKAVLETV